MTGAIPSTLPVENKAERHANYSHDFWTPQPWLDWVSATFGTDDWFDPCPRHWSPESGDGLALCWVDGCYVNHPGARGSTVPWWGRYLEQRDELPHFIWCAFSIEQFRHMRPSALELPGWLVAPRTRTSFIWGGPDMPATPARAARIHGEPLRSPGNWSAWWSTVAPAPPPVDSIVLRTGG